MSRDANEMAKKWAAHNEGRFISIGMTGKVRRPKATGMGRNTSYDGDKYKSYRTVIASYFTNPKNNKRYVLITNERFSRTTDSHMQDVANNAMVPVFVVPNLGQDYTSMLGNCEYLFQEARDFAEEAKKKWKAEWGFYTDVHWRQELTRLFNVGIDYILASGIAYAWTWSLGDTIADVAAYRKMKLDYFNHPTQAAKRERVRARRLANSII